MAVSVTGNINLLINIIDSRTAVTGAAGEVGSRIISPSWGGWAIASGTGVGQADKVWCDTRTVTTGATDAIDMAGTLTDSFGAVVTFVKLRAIVAFAALTNTTTLKIQRPAANGTTLFDAAGAIVSGLAAVSFGGLMIAWADPQAGVAVAAGTTDLITAVNSAGASASYTIAILGTSA
jgi:hypothetical protein